MIGSSKVDDPYLPPEVEALLPPQEKAKFEKWKRAQQQAVAREKQAAVLDILDDVMICSCMALDVGAGTVKDPVRIWDICQVVHHEAVATREHLATNHINFPTGDVAVDAIQEGR